jgi:hypothetical protein
MEPVTWGFIGTLLGTVVGASASIATTFITANNSRKLQEGAESIERRERARDFQRNNLLELQEALSTSMRLIGRAHLEDVKSFRKNEDDNRSSLLSEDLNQDLMASSRALAILTVRVSDESLRESLRALRSEMNNVLMAKNEVESSSALQRCSSDFEKTMENLGVVLRSAY